jgi:hypothetical protein
MPANLNDCFSPLDLESLRARYQAAEPFPYFAIDGFLKPQFASQVASAYPDFESARAIGTAFNAVNERLKIQITDDSTFPPPVRQLSDALASRPWLDALTYITGIETLLADPDLAGGGMHVTGPGGRLDVHVDFNYNADRDWHRRLNVLLYLNPVWQDEWGGRIELWDDQVTTCARSFAPVLNRCVVFETSERSYHGVTPVRSPHPTLRQSFAAYYYTAEAPEHWDGTKHSTVFKARPNERFRKYVAMPLEQAKRRLKAAESNLKTRIKSAFGTTHRSS